MNKVILMMLLAFTLTSAQAADAGEIISDKTYACISDAAAGLNWNGSRWEATNFKPYGKFLLNVSIIEDNFIHKQFIHFNLKGDGKEEHCGEEYFSFEEAFIGASLHCMQAGRSIAFSEQNERGGVSYLLGATDADNRRDSLAVMSFTCQKF